MGMTYLEYARTTWSQFNLKQEGYFKKELEEWRRTRLIAWWVYNSIEKDKSHTDKSLTEFMPLPDDPKERKKRATRIDSLFAKYVAAGLVKDGKIVYN